MKKLASSMAKASFCPTPFLSEEKTFAALYTSLYGDLYAVSFQLCQSKQVAEDVVQDLFTKLWMSREKLSDIKDPRAYLFQMSRNLTLTQLRSQKRKEQVFKQYALIKNEEARHSYLVEEKELAQIVQKSISNLPNRQKTVFHLKKTLGWRRVKIAQTLEISPDTVRVTLRNAMVKIKSQINTYERSKERST